jgi:hypothetical protein
MIKVCMILGKRMVISKLLVGDAAPPGCYSLGLGVGLWYYVNELQRPLNS